MKPHAKESISCFPFLTSSAASAGRVAIAFILPLLIFIFLWAKVEANTIDLRTFAAPRDAIKSTVPADHVVWLTLITKGPSDKMVQLSLTEFRDDQGNPAIVRFMPEPGTDREPQTEIKKQIDSERLTLRLDGSALSPGRVYTGELWVKKHTGLLTPFTVQLEMQKPDLFQGAPSTATSKKVAVPADGITTVNLDAGPLRGYGAKAVFKLSTFTGQKNGETVHVYLLDADRSRQTELKDVSLAMDRIPIVLDAADLDPDQTYVGEILISIKEHRLPSFALELTRESMPRNAVIEVDQLLPIKVECHYKCKPPPIKIILQEKSGQLPLIGISVEPSRSPGEGGLNPSTDLAVKMISGPEDDQKIENLWHFDPDNSAEVKRRSISAAGQAVLQVEFEKELSPGIYKTALHVRSLNAKLDELPELGITAEIEYPWWYALVILVVAVVVSFTVTKG
ncbi:MAG: hypothetical protein ACYSSN_12350, partial [Planctomycetota bacterium]